MKRNLDTTGPWLPETPAQVQKQPNAPHWAGKEEGTSRAIPNYPRHSAVQSLPMCPSEEKSPQNKKESESSGTPPPGVTAVSKGRDVAAAKEGALPSLCSAPSVVDGSLH